MTPFLMMIGEETLQPHDARFWLLLPHDLFFVTLSYGLWLAIGIKCCGRTILNKPYLALFQLLPALGVLWVLGLPTHFTSPYAASTSLFTVYACFALYGIGRAIARYKQ
ncbi:hypothetical protein J4N42_15290 [Vibrio sp. SCSIO 43135]|uniref:hypothetical protein n=1 Tax=Vibrio sp. SCSIO 43135 TaxID=2819096 RepID=UPI0020762166|nr:hypothetical protein [Vibrio sp. SCSIO 43135]USD43539.1 hypothetical protein J4N42_15290 [Vibrio sp. SCSIO 43135]